MKKEEFKKITKFTDIVAWQEGHKLVLMVYEETDNFPKKENFGLTSQTRRAAVSFTSNIAEGFAKKSKKEKERYFSMAQTSLIELQNQILISKDVGYVDTIEFRKVAEQTVVCHKLIIGLLKATRLGKYKE